jgi:protein tyrosine phosphatase (PTP) superfamily phosphohydrolase (DUF442 family)
MSELEAIRHYMQISSRVATAGQPELEQLETIADAGYEVVINLALTTSDYAIADEAAWVAQLGMQYIHIPVEFTAPSEQDFIRFVNAMNLHRDKKCFVHCALNRRVSVFMALYQMITGELDGDAAWLQIKCIWEPDPVWQAFIAMILDKFKQAVRGNMPLQPPPESSA